RAGHAKRRACGVRPQDAVARGEPDPGLRDGVPRRLDLDDEVEACNEVDEIRRGPALDEANVGQRLLDAQAHGLELGDVFRPEVGEDDVHVDLSRDIDAGYCGRQRLETTRLGARNVGQDSVDRL